MKKTIMIALLVLGLLPAAALAQESKRNSDLEKQAKVTKEQATKTALARVPNGTIKEAELEKEKGKLIWSFDIAKPGAKGITEVQVDAITGKVVSVTHESASAEAAEKKAEQGKPKKPKP